MAILNQTDASTTVTINSGDVIYIAPEINIVTTSGDALVVSFSGSLTSGEVHNFGDLVALDGEGLALDASGTSVFNHGTILAGSGSDAVRLSGDDIVFQNFGLVQAAVGHAMEF